MSEKLRAQQLTGIKNSDFPMATVTEARPVQNPLSGGSPGRRPCASIPIILRLIPHTPDIVRNAPEFAC